MRNKCVILLLALFLPSIPVMTTATDGASGYIFLDDLELTISDSSSEYLMFSSIRLDGSSAISYWVDFEANASVGIRLILEFRSAESVSITPTRRTLVDEIYVETNTTIRFFGSYEFDERVRVSLYLQLYKVAKDSVKAISEGRYNGYTLFYGDGNITVDTQAFPALKLLDSKEYFEKRYSADWELVLPVISYSSTLADVEVRVELSLDTGGKNEVSVGLNDNEESLVITDQILNLPVRLQSVRLYDKNVLRVDATAYGNARPLSVSIQLKEENRPYIPDLEMSIQDIAMMVILLSWGLYFVSYRRRKE